MKIAAGDSAYAPIARWALQAPAALGRHLAMSGAEAHLLAAPAS